MKLQAAAVGQCDGAGKKMGHPFSKATVALAFTTRPRFSKAFQRA
jgi:hypothetical protein